MKLCTSVLWYILIIETNTPQQFALPGGRHIDFQYGAKMTIVLSISPVPLHLGPHFKCLYLSFRCLGTFRQCQNLRQEAAILDFKMTAKCFTLLCISRIIALWKEKKNSTPRKMFTIWKLSSYDRHIGIQDGHHIIRHAVFHADICRLPCKLSLRKFVYHHFDQMAAIFNFPMQPVVFSVIEHTKMHIHVS